MAFDVLIGMETSGKVREAFRSRGHNAWSCDLLPAQDGSPNHFQCDIMEVLRRPWHIVVLHPDCTYLTISAEWAYGPGPYHQKVKPETPVGQRRCQLRDEAVAFVKTLERETEHVPVVCFENPVGVLGRRWRPHTQSVQPYDLGDDASKRTCLWIKGAPPLSIDPALRFPGRWVEWPRGSGKLVERWSNQTDSGQNRLSPGDDRWQVRANTYPGIANALADQLPAAMKYRLL